MVQSVNGAMWVRLMWHMIRVTRVAALAAFACTIIAQTAHAVEPVVFDLRLGSMPILSHAEEYEDVGGKDTIERVRQRRFTPVTSATYEKGFSNSTFWIRFEIENPGNAPLSLVLESKSGHLSEIDFYHFRGDELLSSVQTGVIRPPTTRAIHEPQFSFPILLPAHATHMFYLRVHTVSHVYLLPTLKTSTRYMNNKLIERLMDNLFYGVATGLIIYNFFIFFISRERAFGYYSGHLLFTVLTLSAADEGSLLIYWPAFLNGFEYKAFFLFAGLSTLFAVLFVQEFLQVKKHSRRYSAINRWIVKSYLIVIVPLLFADPLVVTYVTMFLVVVIWSYLFWQGCALWRKRVQNASFYVFASGLLVTLLAFTMAWSPVHVQHDYFSFAHLGTNIGFTVQMLMLSVGLGRRLNDLKRREIVKAKQLDQMRALQFEADREKLKVEAKSAAKSQFFASMSHEIRTPMNGILGMLELLRHTTLTDKQRQYADTVQNSAKNLLMILNDILDFSKIEAGKMEIEHIRFSVRAVLEEVHALFVAVDDKPVVMKLDVDPAIAQSVTGDPSRLRQILSNLVNNAHKFTERGEVLLCARQLAPGRLEFEVRDSGIGIPAEHLQQIFESFSQTDSSISRRYGGSGLGLAICQRLVQLMGGKIDLRSKMGIGTQVIFDLPLPSVLRPEQQGSEAVHADEHESAEAQALILVVEDNKVNQDVVVGQLERLGFAAVVKTNGVEAIDEFRLNHNRYQLILMDCEMPQMDGFSACKAMREYERTNTLLPLPIIAISAHTVEYSRQRAKLAGFDTFLNKPVSMEVMERTIKRYRVQSPGAHSMDEEEV